MSKKAYTTIKSAVKARSKSKVSATADAATITAEEINVARGILERALWPRAVPNHSGDERFALAVLAADLSIRQSIKGKKSKSPSKLAAEYRRNRVNLLLRYVINKKFRKNYKAATSDSTRMEIINWLDKTGIEANPSQVWRDIKAVMKREPLSTA